MNDDLLSQLERLAKLKDQGVISEEEFLQQKANLFKPTASPIARALAPSPTPTSTGKKSNWKIWLYVFLGFAVVGGISRLFEPEKAPDKNAANVSTSTETTAEAPKSRREVVEGFFSGWDGSHRQLEKAIKESMNDPDSYEHVETRFKDNGSTIYVLTKFRGKNAFGGKIVNYAEGNIDGNDGHLIDWKFVKQ
ncbi:SHOCT domain-containing protein [Spirosoma endbachense]|uniref:SHOCT domain-containing protein n=1 Tax=Spirosoma endbachense TaxID=2666025 RepID=UPI0018E08EA1|nr:SHOCT domain-containing protein [Spirosoma endbachense]